MNDTEKLPLPTSSSQPINATAMVSIKDRGMTACITITPPCNGGTDLTMDALMKLLVNENGIKNIDLMRLKSLSLKPVYCEDIVVATGTLPVMGRDGTVTFKVRTENIGKPKELENGKVDYYDLGLIENVCKDQVLCILTPAIEGTPGYTVKGEMLKPRSVKPAPVIPGINTLLTEDGLQIVSKIDGQLEYDGRKISVNETYTLCQDVDTSTGNVKVAGNLVIRGMVTSGFTISAGGYITVSGVVDSSTVTSGKDINFQGGAIGSNITCGGNLTSRFIENCEVKTRGDIRAEYVLNCTVHCKKNLKTEGAISKIIGGNIVVMQNVECKTLGSSAGVKTKLEIGNDPEIIARQRQLTLMIPDIEKQLASLEPLLKLLTQLEAANRLDEEKAETLSKARYSHKTQQDMLNSAKEELESINTSIYNKKFGKVVCYGSMYPGTVVTIGSASYTATSTLIGTTLFYADGAIVLGAAH